MTDPSSSIDSRFSEPGAQAVSWEETRQVLDSAELFWITTVRADGRPHVTPLVAVWLDDALHFCTGAEEQKGVNLRHHASVALTTGCNDWQRGIDVVVEGEAVRTTDPDTLERLAEKWAGKWDGRWQFEARDGAFHHPDGGDALVYTIRPRKVLTFGKGTFSHTRHRFSA